jgi:hypothetical protein
VTEGHGLKASSAPDLNRNLQQKLLQILVTIQAVAHLPSLQLQLPLTLHVGSTYAQQQRAVLGLRCNRHDVPLLLQQGGCSCVRALAHYNPPSAASERSTAARQGVARETAAAASGEHAW